jgi:aminomethyltransferase
MNENQFISALTIGPRVRKSPFFDATLAAGVKSFTVYNHMYLPTRASPCGTFHVNGRLK